MPFFMEFSCGCKHNFKDCYRKITISGRQCPKHLDANIKQISFQCEVCGKEEIINYSLKSLTKKYCSKQCYKTAKNKRSRLNFRSAYIGTRKRIPTPEPVAKPDCKHYLSKCLLEVCKDSNVKAVRCNNCPRYEKQELDILEYETGAGTDDIINYTFIPDGFTKDFQKVIKHREKQAGKKQISDRKAKASYLWGYQHNGRKKAIEKAKERSKQYANE